jgi:hypothetical protein
VGCDVICVVVLTTMRCQAEKMEGFHFSDGSARCIDIQNLEYNIVLDFSRFG